MTKNNLRLLLALLLTAPAGAAELALPTLGAIRAKAFSSDGAAPRFIPAAYRTENGPAWEDPYLRQIAPQAPPNLTQTQVTALIQRMVDFERAQGGKVTLTKENVQALVVRLVQIDTHFVDQVDAKTWDTILKASGDAMEAQYKASKGDWNKVVETGITTAVKGLKDPHTIYFNEAQLKAFMDSMKGTFVGIGAGIGEDPKGLKLEFIYPGSGAEAAGLKAGDVVTAVNGTPMAGKKPEDIIKLLRGDENTVVTITVERGGVAQKPVAVTRKTVKMPTAFSKMAASGVGYVYWNQFGDGSETQVLAHVRRLKAQGAKSVILDVRGNPGGLVSSVSAIASEFMKDGQEIVSFRRQGQVVFKHVAQGKGEFADMPVAVLTDGGSASASEILAAAIQDQRPGYVVIGSQSYGKGTQQSILPGADKGGLKITESRWHRPNGGNIDAQHDPATGEKVKGTGGVTPSVKVDVPEDQAMKIAQQTANELMGRPVQNRVADPVLDKAVEILSNSGKAG
ncbi:PDZ domain-containing protein [bacterium]|nr:MAG: PDZ domain-containing protein [bacterium]